MNDSLAKLARDIRAGFDAAPDSTPWPLVAENGEWAARLDALRERLLEAKALDPRDWDVDGMLRSIAGETEKGAEE